MHRFDNFRIQMMQTMTEWRDSDYNKTNCGLRILSYAAERLVADLVFSGLIVREGEIPVRLPKDQVMIAVLKMIENCEVMHNTRFNTNLSGYRTLISDISDVVLDYQAN